MTGGKLGGLLMGWARPRVAPREALSREYERQGGEKRHGREGRGARSTAAEKDGVSGGCGATRAASSAAAAGGGGAGQPGEGGEKQKKKPKQRTNRKNQNERPNGRSEYDMKIRGQRRSRQMPRRREGRRGQSRATGRERRCRERSRRAAQGLRQSPARGGPRSGAQGPCWGQWQRGRKRDQGWAGPTCPSGWGLCCFFLYLTAQARVLSWKRKLRAECRGDGQGGSRRGPTFHRAASAATPWPVLL